MAAGDASALSYHSPGASKTESNARTKANGTMKHSSENSCASIELFHYDLEL